MIKKLWPNILIALVSVLLTYVMADIGYRIYRRYKITTEYKEYPFQAIDQPVYLLDEQIGFRYKPNMQVLYANFGGSNEVLQSNKFRVNNLGHISPNDDTVAKPEGEFRIAVIGDSFTAAIHNDIPWPFLLEQRLNADQNLKIKLGVSTIKVINFGMDGTGIVQWPSVVSNEILRFNPDLLVVNFITDDIGRRFVWRTSIKPPQSNGDYYLGLMCSSLPATLENRDCAVLKLITFNTPLFDNKSELSRIKRGIYDEEVGRIDWLSLYPELLARTLGRPLGLRPRLSLSDLQIPYFRTT
ncbi:MAG TPA: SGNH/GDSL hydrolase family protein, partial [Anaerolineae bacterium]